MTSSALSSAAIQTYTEFIWWWLHHSEDEERIAAMLSSYYDESSVDGAGPTAAVGGVVLNHQQYSEMEMEWERALSRGGTGKKFIHMKDFGEHGDLARFPIEDRRKLFSSVVRIINDNKQFSIGATLTPQQYKIHFSFLKKIKKNSEILSIHATCFLLAAVTQGRWAEGVNYPYDIPFMLDEGCSDRADVNNAHLFLRTEIHDYVHPPTHAGGLTWEDDIKFPQLQAADVVAWAVRRRAAGDHFRNGYEPLADIFDSRHIESHYAEDWMKDGSDSLRVKLGR